DLKPENVLLDDEGHVLVTDFGLSKTGLLEYGESGRTGTVCGTIEYMVAPEVVLEHQYDKAVDWWSFGVLIFDMLTGSPPFVGNSRKAIMDNILKKKIVMPPYLTPDARDLITKLLRRNPAQRIGSSPPGAPAAANANPLAPDSPRSPQPGRPARRGRGRQHSDQCRSRSSSPFVSKGQASAIRAHRFFRKIDWDKLIRRELEPPIRPIVLADDDVSNFDSKFTSVPLTNTPPKASVSEMERQLLAANIRYVKRDYDSSALSSPPAVSAECTMESLPASGTSTPKAGATPSATGNLRPIPIRTPVQQRQNDVWQKLAACPDHPPCPAEPGASVDDETLLEQARTLSRSYKSLFKGFSWVAPSLLVEKGKNGDVGTQ
ncbi:MAG: kinase-like domain-containing protein, partial [Olpidium bornovanus]